MSNKQPVKLDIMSILTDPSTSIALKSWWFAIHSCTMLLKEWSGLLSSSNKGSEHRTIELLKTMEERRDWLQEVQAEYEEKYAELGKYSYPSHEEREEARDSVEIDSIASSADNLTYMAFQELEFVRQEIKEKLEQVPFRSSKNFSYLFKFNKNSYYYDWGPKKTFGEVFFSVPSRVKYMEYLLSVSQTCGDRLPFLLNEGTCPLECPSDAYFDPALWLLLHGKNPRNRKA